MIDNINKMNSKDTYILNRNKLLTGIVVAGIGIALGTTSITSNNQDSNETVPIEENIEAEADQNEEFITIKIGIKNYENIDKDASLLVVDSRNVVAAYMLIYPDGTMDYNDMFMYPDEEYRILVCYNDKKITTEYNTKSIVDGENYTMTIDFATESVEISADQDVKTR